MRSSQRGHAGFAAGDFRPYDNSRLKRASLFSGAVVVAALVIAGGWKVGPSLGKWLDFTGKTSTEDTAALASPSPSLIDSAHATTTAPAPLAETPEALPTPYTSSGLIKHSLNAEHLGKIDALIGNAEARLIGVYQRIGKGELRQALAEAESLASDHPNYQLAQLVLGDLLNMRTGVDTLVSVGGLVNPPTPEAKLQLMALREESQRRLQALAERPPVGAIPSQFLALSPQNRHAIAIDTSRSRLYLFENKAYKRTSKKLHDIELSAPKLKLIGDYYISVGLLGVNKQVEGDKRTPLGVYFITSNLDPNSLPDLYGAGALPINYPNALDLQRGKTGSGIWLHGTPREQFVRAPQASDGCVVLSNQDLEHLLETVSVRTTPVVITNELQWVDPAEADVQQASIKPLLEQWKQAKSEGKLEQLKQFYANDFSAEGGETRRWWRNTMKDMRRKGSKRVALKDVSVLRWNDGDDTFVVTFGEVRDGERSGVTRRQYWSRRNGEWKIFFEGTV
ncbi:L,D-transpeptidase [Hydrogenophaga sp. 5NK40-0174]|uniref:L,D-transpeptidase family protein n=1 Tax=Hydrogenophaga sp. 5NK40-0174 TaxID=3127649 RepID=UPI0031092519